MRFPIIPAAMSVVFASFFPAVTAEPETVPVDSDRWSWDAQEQRIEERLGRPAVYLKGGIGTVEGVELENGMIEFDISFTGERGFVGAIWRVAGAGNYEEFYLRPHQSENPDATQYTPIFNGSAGWQLYHGDGFAAAVRLPRDEWIPVRILFAGSRGEVYIGDMQSPAVTIHELKHAARSGSVGLMAGGSFAPAWFSNFRYSKIAPSALKGEFRKPEVGEPGTITVWSISNAVAEEQLDDPGELSWTGLETEKSGLANLARIQGISRERNSVFARRVLDSPRAQLVRFRFGYSDRVKVFLNGRAIYAGNNTYLTRDYRYLGTIGLFDELFLNLKQGENDLRIAVTEDFGGWGLIGQLDPAAGVAVGRSDP